MQVEYKTENGVVLFVKVPDDANTFTKITFEINYIKFYNDKLIYVLIIPEIKENGFKLIGLTSEVTEEQAKMMVDVLKYGMHDHMQCFKDYHNFGVVDFKDGVKSEGYGVELSLDSFNSLMQHLQIIEGKWAVLFKPSDTNLF